MPHVKPYLRVLALVCIAIALSLLVTGCYSTSRSSHFGNTNIVCKSVCHDGFCAQRCKGPKIVH